MKKKAPAKTRASKTPTSKASRKGQGKQSFHLDPTTPPGGMTPKATGASLHISPKTTPGKKTRQSPEEITKAFRVENNFKNLPADDLEAACKYEYLRESQPLISCLKSGVTKSQHDVLPSLNLSLGSRYRLVLGLDRVGFPKPWNTLGRNARNELCALLKERLQPKTHPALEIEDAKMERDFDEEERQGQSHDLENYCWRIEPSFPALAQGKEYSDRQWSFFVLRIDEAYNETEACAAFKAWYAKRYGKGKRGNEQHWKGKLNQLTAMRARHYFRRRDREAIIEKLTGKKSYIQETKFEYPTNQSDIALTRDCAGALEYFQRLFPGQIPIHFGLRKT